MTPTFTPREEAAIRLRSPTSGTPWLDDMILQSIRADISARAMQAYLPKMSRIGEADFGWLAKFSQEIARCMTQDLTPPPSQDAPQ